MRGGEIYITIFRQSTIFFTCRTQSYHSHRQTKSTLTIAHESTRYESKYKENTSHNIMKALINILPSAIAKAVNAKKNISVRKKYITQNFSWIV